MIYVIVAICIFKNCFPMKSVIEVNLRSMQPSITHLVTLVTMRYLIIFIRQFVY